MTIRKIECNKVAGGLSGTGKAGFGALGAAIAGTVAALPLLVAQAGATVATGGAALAGAPAVAAVTVPLIMVAASKGNDAAQTALKFMDSMFSGQDDLIVHVDGKQVIPSNGDKYHGIRANEQLKTNIKVSFKGSVRVQIIEYDSGSDNDDLGSVDIIGGRDRDVDRLVIQGPLAEGSVYYLTYTVEKGKGTATDVVNWMLCGTNECTSCGGDAECGNTDYSQLDRDKDWSDLRGCPDGFDTSKYRKFKQRWPAADVWLRVCKRNGA